MKTTSRRRPLEARPLIFGASLALAGGVVGTAAALAAGLVGAVVAVLVVACGAGLVLARFGASLFGARAEEAPAEAPAAPKPAAPAPSPEPKREIPPDRIDELTGLANENGLAAWFIEKRGRLSEDNKSIVVMVANLDSFEELQRSRGKVLADSILVEVARRVSGFTGEDGIAARISGDEIMAVATIVPDHALDFAETRAGMMAETICRPAELATGALWIGGSVGAAVGKPTEGDAVLARARAAFAKAKRLGNGRYVVDGGGTQT
jgi:diguanylate cyclase (GGDEF)-like protein